VFVESWATSTTSCVSRRRGASDWARSSWFTHVARGLRFPEESAREAAAKHSADLHATEYLDSLANCVRDSDVGVREAVAYGWNGDARGAGAARTLLTDHRETVRPRALIALARLSSPT